MHWNMGGGLYHQSDSVGIDQGYGHFDVLSLQEGVEPERVEGDVEPVPVAAWVARCYSLASSPGRSHSSFRA